MSLQPPHWTELGTRLLSFFRPRGEMRYRIAKGGLVTIRLKALPPARMSKHNHNRTPYKGCSLKGVLFPQCPQETWNAVLVGYIL